MCVCVCVCVCACVCVCVCVFVCVCLCVCVCVLYVTYIMPKTSRGGGGGGSKPPPPPPPPHAYLCVFSVVVMQTMFFVQSFQAEISGGLCTDGAMFGEQCSGQLKMAIAQHLFREGKMEVGQALLQEAGISLPLEDIGKFSDMNRILDALSRKEVEPALE